MDSGLFSAIAGARTFIANAGGRRLALLITLALVVVGGGSALAATASHRDHKSSKHARTHHRAAHHKKARKHHKLAKHTFAATLLRTQQTPTGATSGSTSGDAGGTSFASLNMFAPLAPFTVPNNLPSGSACAPTITPVTTPSAANLAPSCFDAKNGDVTTTGPNLFDWDGIAIASNNFTTAGSTFINDGTGTSDVTFTSGAKEQDQSTWTLTQSSVPAKSDILHVATYSESVSGGNVTGSNDFFYGAFDRASNNGDVNLDFEFNQAQATSGSNLTGSNFPVRQTGDLLITFDGNSSSGSLRLGACIWWAGGGGSSSGWYPIQDGGSTPPPGDLLAGSALCPQINAQTNPAAIGSINSQTIDASVIHNAANTSSFGSSLAHDLFGEVAINLTAAIKLEGTAPACVPFGTGFIHSRSSTSVASALKDYVTPFRLKPAGDCGITVVKHVINDNGGTLTAGNFTMVVTGSNATGSDVSGSSVSGSNLLFPGQESPGTFVPLFEGPYGVTEVQQPGYQASYSGNCNGTVVANADQSTQTCTITNNDIAPRLIVKKIVNNNHGGTKSSSDFTMVISGSNVDASGVTGSGTSGSNTTIPGSATGSTVTLNAGSFNVTEGSVPGYQQVSAVGCSGTIAVGETKTCTITNQDVAPQLTIKKIVQNNHGGTLGSSDFTMVISGSNVDASGVTGSGTSGSNTTIPGSATGSTVTLDQGSFVVTEGAIKGYQQVSAVGCSGTIAVGEAKTCVITNADIAPTLTVIKHVVNDNGGTETASDFTMLVSGANISGSNLTTQTGGVSFNGVDGAGKTVTLDAGSYNVGEDQQPGYTGDGGVGDCGGTAHVGDVLTCTITNDDQPAHLIVKKTVVNDNGGNATAADFTMTVSGSNVSGSTLTNSGSNFATFPGDASGTDITLDAGSYSADEQPFAGYQQTGNTCLNGTILPGETKHCTITNDDIAPTLTVIKHVINDNGGTETASDFTMLVSGTNISGSNLTTQSGGVSFAGADGPGVTVTLDANHAYNVGEVTQSGYKGTIGTDVGVDECFGALAPGDHAVCHITNDDIAPTLTVVKHVVNNDGGSATAGNFTMTASGSNLKVSGTNISGANVQFPGSGGTVLTLDANHDYSVGELPFAGYTGDGGDSGCTGNLPPGGSATCTITNDDQPAYLVVTKDVVNDNGGSLTPHDFTMDVTGSNLHVSGTNISGANVQFPGDSGGTVVKVDPGSYSIDEIQQAGYAEHLGTAIGDQCSGTIALGETRFCTIVNNDIAPQLTVIKHVVNNDGGTDTAGNFTMTVSGSNLDVSGTNDSGGNVQFPGDEGGTVLTLDANHDYSVDELAHAGYQKTDASSGCTGNLKPGDTATCTITNDDIAPTLTVVKHVVNDNGGTETAGNFTMTVSGSNLAVSGTDISGDNVQFPGSGGTDVKVEANHPFDVGELSEFGYHQTSEVGDCHTSLAPGAHGTCTITNDDVAPTLTVIKHVVNNDGGTETAGNFTMTVSGSNLDVSGTNNSGGNVQFPGDEGGTQLTLDANHDYSVDELAHDGYTKSIGDTGCTGNLPPGGSATCTITNDDQPAHVIVTKLVVNDNGGNLQPSDFTMTVSGSNVTGSNVTASGSNMGTFPGDASGSDITLSAGGFSVGEVEQSGYAETVGTAAGDVCSGTILPGETKHCTIVNDDIAPTLTVVKHVINDDGGTETAGDFTMTVTGSNLDVSGTDNSGSDVQFPGDESGTNLTLDANHDYNVGELADKGYATTIGTQQGDQCSGQLLPGQNAVCHVTNDDIAPKLTVIKHVVNLNGGDKTAHDFTMLVSGTNITGIGLTAQFGGVAFPGDESGTNMTLSAGAYNVGENELPGYMQAQSGDCGGIAQVGDVLTCTITNSDEPATLTVIKHVVNDNGGTDTAGNFTMTVSGSNLELSGSNTTSSNLQFPGDDGGTDVVLGANQAYDVGELSHDGYQQTSEVGDCHTSLPPGGHGTCTITNDDIAPKLTVVKHVINDNGGTESASDFTMLVTGSNLELSGSNATASNLQFPGDEGGTSMTLEAGQPYSVDEGDHSGYTESVGDNCSGTLKPGDDVTCTITNNDQSAHLIVVKHVVNDNGGSETAGDFTMQATGSNLELSGSNATASNLQFPGDEGGTHLTLDANQPYTVDEGDHSGYSETVGQDCSGTIAPGQTKTCTIVNDDIAPTLTVIKHVVNGQFGGKSASDFTMLATGSNLDVSGSDNSGDNVQFPGDENGTVLTLDANHDYSANEVQDSGYVETLSDTGCTGNLPPGGHATCTITNTQKATVTVAKVTDPAGDTQPFHFTGSNVALGGGDFHVDGGSQVSYQVPAGDYSITEPAADAQALGYKLESRECVQDTPPETPALKAPTPAADPTVGLTVGVGEHWTCTFTNHKLSSGIAVKKTGPAFAYDGDQLTYTYAVTSTGPDPLKDVTVTDDKCSPVTGPVSKQNDNGDAWLDKVGADGVNPEVWIYTCTTTAPPSKIGDPPLVNTATATGTDEFGNKPTATDTWSTPRLHPGISIVKTGPATATAGDLVTYTLNVKNTGDTAFPATGVAVTDALCQAPPALQGTNGDATPNTLDPGDTWTYTCQVQSQPGQTLIDNIGKVQGTDIHGRVVNDQSEAKTTLNQIVVAPVRIGSAKLRGSQGCIARTHASAMIRGELIAKVTFYVDGKKVKTLKKPNYKGKYYRLTVSSKRLRFGAHRVKAVVVFQSGVKPSKKTLALTFTRCKPVKPKFTG